MVTMVETAPHPPCCPGPPSPAAARPSAQEQTVSRIRTAAAGRFRRPSWREPRLLIGLGLVVVSLAATTAAVTYGDATEPFAVAAHDLEVGEEVGADDLRAADLRLESTGEAYLSGAQDLREGAVVVDRVAEGQLIPVDSIGRRQDLDRRPIGIPLSTPLPTGTEPGGLVDIWAAERERTGGDWSEPEQILEGAELAGVEDAAGGLGADADAAAQVLVDSDDVEDVVAALSGESRITLVPHLGGGR